MKKYLTLILLLLTVGSFAQNRFIEKFDKADPHYIDSVRKVCEERGHINGSSLFMSTLIYCSPRIEETEDYTVKITGGCNYLSYTCARCSEYISELEPTYYDTVWIKSIKNKVRSWIFPYSQGDLNNLPEFNPITVEMVLSYVKECSLDTIMVTKIMDDFIVNRGSYREAMSETQLNKEGYFYEYRWVISTNPFKFEYYFIKQPTLKGFAEWLENKKRLDQQKKDVQ